MLEKYEKNRILLVFVAVVAYFCLEPTLTQMFALRAFSLVYIPYSVIRTIAPWIIFALFLYELVKRRGKIHLGAIVPITGVFVAFLIPTAIAGENMNVWVETVLPLAAYYILLLPICFEIKNLTFFVRIVTDVFLVLESANLMFSFFPQLYATIGLWVPEAFLTTIENQVGFPIVMGLMFALLDYHLNNRKILPFVYLVEYLITVYVTWTAAQVIGAAIVVLYLIKPFRLLFEKINVIWWIGISFAVFVVLVFFWEPFKSIELIRSFIVDVLKKDVTFTGRINIWSGVWEMVKQKPLLGHGMMDNPQMLFYDSEFNQNYVHAHNGFLQTWYEAGAVSLIAILGMFVFTGIKCRENHDKKIIGIFNLVLLLFLINFEMDEFFIFPWRTCMWCMMCFICNFAVLVAENDY